MGACVVGSAAAFGLLMVSSTDKIMQHASHAATRAFTLIRDGSQTHASKLSAMCSFVMSTPYQQLPGKEPEKTHFNLGISGKGKIYWTISFLEIYYTSLGDSKRNVCRENIVNVAAMFSTIFFKLWTSK
jgi:hypothetical protein